MHEVTGRSVCGYYRDGKRLAALYEKDGGLLMIREKGVRLQVEERTGFSTFEEVPDKDMAG